MIVKNDYNECLTNLACSIRKYFGLDYKHNTLSYIDSLLEKYKPKNVVTILCDGMGSNILDRTLSKDSFFIRNKLKSISTVFPATTVAATTSMMTGLNPVESGMLGWDMYFKDIDKTITTFLGSEKGDFNYKPLKEAIDFINKHMKRKSIMDEINEKGIYKGYTLFPFGPYSYSNWDDMLRILKSRCDEDGKKYIYAYSKEPDSTMHKTGCDSDDSKKVIIELNDKIEQLCKQLNDTIIFVVADHGHKNVINIDLKEYPDIINCLIRNTSLEPRTVNFFVKDDKKEEFENLFTKYFSTDFDLYAKTEVISSKLFGYGEENEIFQDSLGDYLAIAKTDKTLLYIGNEVLKSHHAGYTDDEIYVPLIVVNKSLSYCCRQK